MTTQGRRVSERQAIGLASVAFGLSKKSRWRLLRARVESIGSATRLRETWVVVFENLDAVQTGFEPSICTVEVNARTGSAKVKRFVLSA